MKEVVCAVKPESLPEATPDKVPVLLYGTPSRSPSGISIGNQLLTAVRRLGVSVPQHAFDFLTIGLAVTAADTFVRREDASDGWCREIRLVVPLAEPERWLPTRTLFEKALHFLSGDIWILDIQPGGREPPSPQTRGRLVELKNHDCACLFSGGLDSTIGALDLANLGRRPVLVSHSYRSDKEKQEELWRTLPGRLSRFAACANPVSPSPNDTTMRTRSLNFLAYGALVGATLSSAQGAGLVTLFVPENGWIALNPPLTPRRIGALSTRTTHPYFLSLVQQILTLADLPIALENPYRLKTKGEMVRQCLDTERLMPLVKKTVSCGKWKRTGRQCGRCVPCLIRHAALHAAGWTDYTDYRYPDLRAVLANEDERDDVLSVLVAIKQAETARIEHWVTLSGPLPRDAEERAQHIDVFRRGLTEMRAFLASRGLLL